MGEKIDKPDADAALEREIRQARTFTPQEALGRLAGAGAMKGASVVSREQQAENEIRFWLRTHITDPTGVLVTVLHRQLKGSELLLKTVDRPLIALASHCRTLLASDHLLSEFVREADVEWARVMDERPYFERQGSPAHPDDPFTINSVCSALENIVERLSS